MTRPEDRLLPRPYRYLAVGYGFHRHLTQLDNPTVTTYLLSMTICLLLLWLMFESDASTTTTRRSTTDGQ